MTLTLIALSVTVAGLFVLLAFALRGSGQSKNPPTVSNTLEETSPVHINFLPQIRQTLQREDDQFLARMGAGGLRRRVSRERRRVALTYLSALRQDFEGLMRISRVIAALSPEIGVAQEFERLRLTVKFRWRYQILWLSLWAGFGALPQMNDLSNLLSGYSVRLEAAMKELGERAALVAEMVSSADRRRIHPV